MKSYEFYKQSEINWLRSIPEHWKITDLKYLADISFSSVDRHEYPSENKVFICHYPNAYKNEKITSETVLSKGTCSDSELEKYQLRKGQTILTKDSESANDIGVPTFISDHIFNAVCGYHLAIVDPKPSLVAAEYIFRYIQHTGTQYYFETSVNGVTRYGLGKGTISSLKALVPPIQEQTKIVEYLNYHTSRIDTLIAQKEALIRKLEEYRKSLINEAVTKGLNPDVPMKDSGVEWLGKIPVDWKIKKLGYMGSFQNGISKSSEYFGYGFPFLTYKEVYKNEVIPYTLTSLVDSTLEDKNRFSVKKNDVFFTRTSETIEEIGISAICEHTIQDATFAGFLIRFRQQSNNLNSNFNKYFFRSFFVRQFLSSEMNLVTRASLSQELLKRLPVLLPSMKEQISIANYLDNKTRKIDLIKAKAINQITTLKSYRQSLVSEAVTGKIDVREWQP